MPPAECIRSISVARYAWIDTLVLVKVLFFTTKATPSQLYGRGLPGKNIAPVERVNLLCASLGMGGLGEEHVGDSDFFGAIVNRAVGSFIDARLRRRSDQVLHQEIPGQQRKHNDRNPP